MVFLTRRRTKSRWKKIDPPCVASVFFFFFSTSVKTASSSVDVYGKLHGDLTISKSHGTWLYHGIYGNVKKGQRPGKSAVGIYETTIERRI